MTDTRAVLFDMDGVVVDSMKIHVMAWKTVLSDYRLVLDDLDIFKREGMSGRASVEDIFREKGVPVPADKEFKLLMSRKHEYFENHRPEIYPGITPVLEYLESRHVKTGLVTGSLKRSVDHVLPREMLFSFSAVITADDVENGKPDPEPYLKCLEAVSCGPGEALVVENAPMGILAAKNAGLLCYALETTLSGEYLSGADRIFHDHDDLYRFIRESL